MSSETAEEIKILPTTMWFTRSVSGHCTVREWLNHTSEGLADFAMHRATKNAPDKILDNTIFGHVYRMDDLAAKWRFCQLFNYSHYNMGFSIDFENEIVRKYWHLKPPSYTIEYDRSHHLGWLIELALNNKYCKEGTYDGTELCRLILRDLNMKLIRGYL